MAESSKEPLEARQLDEYLEIAVDGRTIMRVEEISDIKKSDVDLAVIAQLLSENAQSIAEELDEKHDETPEEILERADPAIEGITSDSESWEEW